MSREFDVRKHTEGIIEFIRNYFRENHLRGAVLGISGGKDSGVVAGLLSLALGPENVVGITMPCHSNPTDKSDAHLVAERFGFEMLNLDLTSTFDSFVAEAGKIADCSNPLSNANINLKPRLRMATNYYIAALLSEIRGGTWIVAGTSNKCELYVGYFTKGGDSTYDIGILNDLTVEEVIAVGAYIGVPEPVLYKAPNDGLSAKTDEDKLGVKYSEIAKVINGQEGEGQERIEQLHRNAQHKFHTPYYKKCD